LRWRCISQIWHRAHSPVDGVACEFVEDEQGLGGLGAQDVEARWGVGLIVYRGIEGIEGIEGIGGIEGIEGIEN
jgi:hypothetical protein